MKEKYILYCFSTVLLFCTCAFNFESRGQQPFDGINYANHWVNPSQPYVRLGVKVKGIQRVQLSKLLAAGFPVTQKEKFQLFHKGKEVSIISLNSEELVFYGEPNDGSTDSLLYRPFSSRANPYTSLFSDEGAYFLTIGSKQSPFATVVNQPLSGTPELYHLKTDVTVFRNEYSQSTLRFIPVPFQSYFENQEGWTSVPIRSNGYMLFNIELRNRYPDLSISPVLEILVNGRQNSINHNVTIAVGQDSLKTTGVATLQFAGISGKKARTTFANSLLTESGKGVLKVQSNVVNDQERNSVTYFSFTYAQKFILPDEGYGYFDLTEAATGGWSRVSIKNAKQGSRIFDITSSDSPKEITPNWTDGDLEIMVPRIKGKSSKLFVAQGSTVVEKIEKTVMHDIGPDKFDFLIVTTPGLFNVVSTEYKSYRESTEGGTHRVLVSNIQDIYNQFNYGEPSPIAIRRFVDFMLSTGDKNKHLLLIGHSTTVPENMIKDLPDEVPSIGFPGSDVLLVDGLGGASVNTLAIPVGRIPAKTESDVRNYLNKLISYEGVNGNSPWKKKMLHLSGGKTSAELNQLKNALSSLIPIVQSGYTGGSVETIVKKTTEPVEQVDISSQVNDGLGMITYFGHGSPTVTDLNMGYISAPERGYTNSERYPFIYFNGCGVGNIFAGGNYTTLSTDWLLTPEKGAIAILANSYFSYYSPTYGYLQFLYKAMFQDTTSSTATLGQIMVKVSKNVVANRPNVYDIANIHQSVLQGDPALRIMQVSKPDFVLDKKRSVFLRSKNMITRIGGSDSLLVGIAMTNAGRYQPGGKVTVQLDRYYEGSQTITSRKELSTFAYRDTAYFTLPVSATLSGVRVILDPDNRIDELDETNNEATLSINWEVAREEIIYWGENIVDKVSPRLNVTFDSRTIRNNEVVSSSPVISILMDDDNLLTTDTSMVDVLIRPCQGDGECNFIRIPYDSGKLQMLSVDGKSLKVIFAPGLLTSGDYELFVNARDLSGNPVAQPYRIGFRITDEVTALKVTNSPNPASGYVRFEATVNNMEVKSIRYQIVDLRGIQIHDEEVSQVRLGTNEWYWYPKGSTGNYFYKVILKTGSSKQIATGKIIVVR